MLPLVRRAATRPRAAPRAARLIALLSLAGLGLRLALLIEAGWRYDYDEGMVGLQVLRILDGARPVFHPGQPYLGALESYLIAPLFAALGASAVTLKIVPWLLAGLYVGTTGWLGWRAFGAQAGVLSALLAACAPVYLLVVGMKTWGATAETLVLGNLALIAASYALDARRRPATRQRAAALTAFAVGVGFWISWLIAFYAVPVAVAFAWHGRALVCRYGWALSVAFLAGSAPLWAYNVRHDFATFHHLLASQGDTLAGLGAVLDHLNYDLAPRMVSGDPTWHLLSWPAIWWLQIAYEGGLIGLIVWAWHGPWPASGQAARLMLALFGPGVPAIYVASGYGNRALNEFGFDATGRYLLMIHSALPIGVAALAVWLVRWRHWLRLPATAALVSVVGLNLLGAARIDPVQAFVSPYYTRQPATLRPLIACLDEQRIRHVWTDVGIAHVLMFETRERILAADWYDLYRARGLVRFPEVPVQIQAAERVAYVEVILPGQTNTRIEQAFRAARIPHTATRVAPDLLVIVPLVRLDPWLVADGLGYQF